MNSIPNNSLTAQLMADFNEIEQRWNGESKQLINQIKKNAFNWFAAMGLPSIRHEEWKYSNINHIAAGSFDFNAQCNEQISFDDLNIPNLEGNILYFVNGVFQPTISTIVSPASEVKIMTLTEAIANRSVVLEKHFAQYATVENDAFTALNTAFAEHGTVIEVPANTAVEQPIIFRFISDTRQENVASQPRTLVVVGENSMVKMAEAFRTLGEKSSFTNAVTEIVLAPHAQLDYYKVQNETQAASHIGTTQIYQQEYSHSYCVTVSVNGGFVRNNLNITLDGEYCQAEMYGVYLPNGTQHIDNHTLVTHAKPNSYSNELYKGLLSGKATGVFNGKIFVKQDAQKTNAYQSCKNAMLSDDATMNTKPQLEIYADDVKCSHGTTTGKLDEEALFYMRARGISRAAAQSLLMLAFAEDVIEKMRIPAIKEYLEGLILEKIRTF